MRLRASAARTSTRLPKRPVPPLPPLPGLAQHEVVSVVWGRARPDGKAMTTPSCGCGSGHLCDAHLAERQRVIAERLDQCDGCRCKDPPMNAADSGRIRALLAADSQTSPLLGQYAGRCPSGIWRECDAEFIALRREGRAAAHFNQPGG